MIKSAERKKQFIQRCNMAISKLVLDALRKKGVNFQTAHSRKRTIRKKVNNAISSEVALDIVAANEGYRCP